jgi:RHS repeat-associated protein
LAQWLMNVKRTAAQILAFTLLTQMVLPTTSIALAQTPPPEISAAEAAPQDQFVEDISQRSTFRKVFRNGDDTKVVLSLVPLHIETQPGVWTEVDNTLVPEEGPFAYHNKLNQFGIHFTGKDAGNQVRFEYKDRAVTFDLDERAFSQSKVAAKVTGNQMRYESVGAPVSLEYAAGGSGLQENIWLERAGAPAEFHFTLSAEGVTPQAQPDGSIWFVYNDSVTERAFYIPPPFAEDANGAQVGVEQQLKALGSGKWSLRVSVDREWLNAQERVFPVRIDPELYADLNGGQWLELNSAGTAWSDQRFVSVYSTTKTAHMQFDMRDFPKSDNTRLSYAELHLPIQQGTGCDANCGGTMWLAQENQEWYKNYATWTKPRWQGSSWTGGQACTSASCAPPMQLSFSDNYSAEQLTSGTTGPWYYDRWFDVTSMVQKWLDGSVPNNGFLMYNSNKTLKLVSPTWQCCTTVSSTLDLYYTGATAPTVTLDATAPTSPVATVVSSAALVKTDLYVDGVLAGSRSGTTGGTYSFSVDATKFPYGAHQLKARAYTISGQTTDSPVVTATFGDGGVTPPVNLAVYPTVGGGMRVTWARASASNPTAAITYTVTRASDSAFTSPVTVATGLTGTTWSDTGVTGTPYYKVQAVTSAGVARAATPAAQAGPPARPFNFTVRNKADGTLLFNWAPSPTALADPDVTYRLTRALAGIPGGTVVAQDLSGTSLQYNPRSTSGSTYGLAAVNAAGQVSSVIYANAASRVYSGPDAPDDLRITVGRDRLIQLNWTSLADPGVTYEIQRCGTDTSCPTVTGITGGTWTEDPGAVSEGRKYQYAVRAVKDGNPGPWSATVGGLASTSLRTGLDPRQAFMGFDWGTQMASVNMSSGNLVVSARDSAIPTPYLSQVVQRTYNSQGNAGTLLGKGWRLNAEWRVEHGESTAPVVVEGDGTEHRFTWNGTDYDPEAWYTGRLSKDPATGTWTLAFPDLLAYEFDVQGDLVRVQEQNGNALIYTHSGGRLTQIDSTPAHRLVTLEYDPVTSLLHRVTDAAGRVTTYDYASDGLLQTVTNNAGEAVRYEYDAQGWLTRTVDAAGRWNYVAYSPAGAVQSVVDGLGNITSPGRTDRLTADISPDPGSRACSLSSALTARVEDPLFNKTWFGLTDQGWISELADAACNKTAFQYTLTGTLLTAYSTTNPRGLVTEYALDAAGHVTQAYAHPGATADTQDLVAPGVTSRTSTAAYDTVTGAVVDEASQVDSSVYHGSTRTYTYAGNAQYPYRLSSSTAQAYTQATGGSKMNAGGAIQYTFDTTDIHPGWVSRVMDQNGNQTDLSYNDDGTLRSITKRNIDADLVSAGVATTSRDVTREFTYEADGQVRDAIDWHLAGTTGLAALHNTYDAVGRQVMGTQPDGARKYTFYDPAGLPVLTIDEAGRSQVLFRDAARRTTDAIAADGGVTLFGYDAAGRNTTVTDPLNHVTTIQYDIANRVTRVTDQNSMAKGYSYDSTGNVTVMTTGSAAMLDQNKGYQVRATYYLSGLQRQTKEPLPISAITTTTGVALPPTDPGDPTDTTYNITTYQYNRVGQQADVADGNGYHLEYAYDSLGRLSTVTQFMSTGNLVTTYGYDNNGNRTSETDARQKTTRYWYDGLNRMWRKTDGRGITTQEYRFDDAGNLVQMMEPRRIDSKVFTSTTSYGYDLAHRMTRTTFQRSITGTNTSYDPMTTNRTFAYDGAGNRVFMWDGRGHNFYTYDLMGRLQEEKSQWQVVSYGYDLASRLTSVTSRLGTVAYVYDAGNRASTVTDPFGNVTTYTYDPNYGTLTSLKLPLGSPNSLTRQDLYYQLSDGRKTNRLQQSTYTKTISGTSSQVWQGAHTYDLPGNMRTFKEVQGTTTLTKTYTYDQAYRLLQADGASGNTSHPNSRYRYDTAGNRTTWGNEVDTAGTVWNYDASNLKWKITQTTDDANRATAIDEVYSSSKQINKQFEYEDNGNVRYEYWHRTGYTNPCSTGGYADRWVFTYYDDASLLVSRHEMDSTRTTNRDNLTTYTYDGDGRRLTQLYQQTDYTGGSGSCTQKAPWAEMTTYEYANGEVLNEQTGGDIPVWYIRDPQGNPLYTLHWRTSQLQPDAYVQDWLGSIRMVLDYQGNVANKYQYDAYGSITTSSSTLKNSYTFTGYGLDQRTSLYYAKARYYRPEIGRFMSQDTWGGSAWAPWTQNRYSYVGGNPVNYVDPTGHIARRYDGGGGGSDEDVVKLLVGLEQAGGGEFSTVIAAHELGISRDVVEKVAYGTLDAEDAKFIILRGDVIGNAQQMIKDGWDPDTVRSSPTYQMVMSRDFPFGALDVVDVTIAGIKTFAAGGILGIGSTGRTIPNNLGEQMAMQSAMSNPGAGKVLTQIDMTDSRWPKSQGWVKMQQTFSMYDGTTVVVHYNYNTISGTVDDFKFK